MKLKHLAYTFKHSNVSKAEAVFLQLVKKKFIHRDYKYQALLGNMIVDFWIKRKGLVIEIDGPEHDPIKDFRRDAFLASFGLKTLRFTNANILNYPKECIKLVTSHPDIFQSHAKASGAIYKLLRNNRFKETKW